MAVYQESIKIKLKQKSRYYALPYATNEITPTFRWDVPYGIGQYAYVFEMRTMTPKKLSNGQTLCAYYSSGKIKTNIPEHKISINLDAETWNGCVEVRLRVYDNDDNEYCTHSMDYSNIYDFEQGYNQFRAWGIRNKNYYFCFDSNINTLVNFYNFSYFFEKSSDANLNQNLKYTLQVADTPIFDSEDKDSLFLEMDNITFVGNAVSISGSFQEKNDKNEYLPEKFTSLLPNKMYYFRVRSFDGYDYSDWSTVNAFGNISNDIPICYIKSIDSIMSGEDRSHGEVKITVEVLDKDAENVNIYFCYSMPTNEQESNLLGVEMNDSTTALDYDVEMDKLAKNKMIRVRLQESSICVPANKEITFTWITGEQISGKKKDYVFLYMVAEDEYSPSVPVNYGPFSIDNSRIGGTVATSASESFNIYGNLQFHLRYLQLPDTILRTRHNLPESDIVLNTDKNNNNSNSSESKFGIQESSKEWLDFWKEDERNSEGFALTVKGDKFYSICPDCKFEYIWKKETYTETIYTDNNVPLSYERTGWSKISSNYSEMELETIAVDQNTVKFRCKKCGKMYSMDWRYREDLRFHIPTDIMKTNYSYYHGYNSSHEHEMQLKQDLQLIRKTEYKAIKEDYELVNGSSSYPYKFTEIEGFEEEVNIDENNSNEKEGWGYIGESPLFTMTRRPDIDSYNLVKPPQSTRPHYAVYVDGQALNMDMNKDYMFDYEDKEEDERIIPGDIYMQELAKQEPWNYMPVLNKIYTESSPGAEDKRSDTFIYCEQNENVQFFQERPKYFFFKSIINAKTSFPFTIRRNVNDRYKIQINDTIYEGSILENGENNRFVSYVYTDGKENQQMSVWKSFFEKILNRAFEFNTVFDANSNTNTASIKYIGKNNRSLKRMKLFSVYSEDGKKDISCYNVLGLECFETYQKWLDIEDEIEISIGGFGENGGTGRVYYYSEYAGELPKGEGSDGSSGGGESGGSSEKKEMITESASDNEFGDNISGGSNGGINESSSKKIIFTRTSNDYQASWTEAKLKLTHGLNCYPFVMIYDNEGKQVYFDTKFVDKDIVIVDFINKSNVKGSWTAIFSYGVPYGKNQFSTSTFNSRIIHFSKNNSSNVTWNNGVVKIYHNLNCYPAIMLYDGNSVQSFFGAKIIDGNNISIDFKNLSNVNGDWKIIVNKAYPYNKEDDTGNYKKISFTAETKEGITWENGVATFSHGLNCYPIISIYDENNELALFETTIKDENTIAVNFGDKSVIKGTWTVFVAKTLGYNESSSGGGIKASGEPLFTCYLDEVDENGHHFKYSEQDYYKTKQVFVRTYHYEICNPFEHPIYGYRNWIVEPIPGKEGRYRKKKVLNTRGVAAEKKMVAIKGEQGEIVYEFGWFNPITNECVSHQKEDKSFTEDGEQIYKKEAERDWQKKIMTQVCIVYDYVDYQQAITKNPTDCFQYHPFNRKAPILLGGSIDKYDSKYGLYILGEYKRRNIDTYGNQIVYNDKGDVILRYPNGDFVYNENEYPMYRNGNSIFYYNNKGDKVEDWSGKYDDYSVVATELKIFDSNGLKLEYDKNGNQILKLKRRNDVEVDDMGYLSHLHKSDDLYVYVNDNYAYDSNGDKIGDGGDRVYRDKQGEFYFYDSDKIYVKGFENISVPVITKIEEAYSFNTEKNESSDFKCTVLDENGNIVYEYDKDGEVVIENGKKKQVYFDNKQINRHKETWDGVIQVDEKKDGKFSELTIDNIVPKFGNNIGVFMKYGYQPEHLVEEYFKKDENGIYTGNYIPENSVYVHDIYHEKYGDLRIGSKFILETNLISDKTLEDVGEHLYDNYYYHETKGMFVKEPHLDYRLCGENQYDERDYFSGMPKDEHEAYKIRPDIAYREDRPWRILGTVNKMVDYSKWSFMYLQNEWNAYNRIHWNFTQNLDEYVILSAIEMDGPGSGAKEVGKRFSVKTKRAIWVNDKWCIPYSGKEANTDSIDTLNNSDFIEGHYYHFYIKTVNKNSGVESTIEVSSPTFTTKREAVSPATITETSYNPWTKILAIKFRLDDVLGRKYDITGVQYSMNDPVVGLDNMDGTWYDLPLEALEGKTQDLGSNTRGDNVPSNNYITYHTVNLDLKQVSKLSSASFRVRLITSLAAEREGLTIPSFQAKMYPNEFLQPVEKVIANLEGSENRWVYETTMNYETGETTGKWVYVNKDKAVRVSGKIQDTQEKMKEIDKKFDEWYCGVAKFRYPDMDGFENYLHTIKSSNGKNTYFEEFYYTYFFDEYLASVNLEEQYKEFKDNIQQGYTDVLKNSKFLTKYLQDNAYDVYYSINREKLLAKKMNELKDKDLMKSYLEWYENNKSESYEKARELFMDGWRNKDGEFKQYEEESLWKDFDEYWKEDESEENGEESESEEEPETEETMTQDEKIIAFLRGVGKINEFNNYYIKLYMYPDTRFEERRALIADIYSEFEQWLNDPRDAFGNQIVFDYFNNLPDNTSLGSDRYISDQIIYFLSYAKANNLINNNTVVNSGKNTAKNAFMQSKVNGISYGQTYQSLSISLSNMTKELQEAYNKKYACEIDHRKYLIEQGFFSNGFLNNLPFKAGGEKNIAFRFRIETQPYEGTINDYKNSAFEENKPAEGEEENEDISQVDFGGYEERWNMYYRVQMDFSDMFNSQPDLKPLRDFLYIGEKSDDNRILAAISDAQNARPTPDSPIINNENSLTNGSSVNERGTDKQFYGSWAIKKVDLPGEYETDVIPNDWDNSFEQLYFWRVAPYNLVRRPIFESMAGKFTKPSVIELQDGFCPEYYYTVDDKRNKENLIYGFNEDTGKETIKLYKMEVYLDNTFAHPDIVESVMGFEKRSFTNDYEGYDYNKARYFIYLPKKPITPIWNNDVKDIAYDRNKAPYNSDWINSNMLDRGEVQFVTDRPRIFEEDSSSSSSSSSLEGLEEQPKKMVFAEDNVKNFRTEWVPFSNQRQKPNVIKYKNHYLMFTHKSIGTLSVDGNRYSRNKIVMARGFSPNIFGEECVTFPRYSNYNPSDVIENALSFDNPCVCEYNSRYYMYFNVLFYDKSIGLYSEIYRAETLDFDEWTNYTKVNIKYNNNMIVNVGEPCVLMKNEIVYETLFNEETQENETVERLVLKCHLFASTKLGTEISNVSGIHYWTSSDGINFDYKEEVYSDMYACYSPSVIIYKDVFKLYFSMMSQEKNKGIILSITYNATNNRWRDAVVEKMNNVNTTNAFGGIDWQQSTDKYFNPCVIWDNSFGCELQRLYFNTYDNPYVYGTSNEYILNDEASELTIHTEYLEEYEWEKKDLREFVSSSNSLTIHGTNKNISIDPISKWDGEKWVNIAYSNNDVNGYNKDFRLPVGILRFQFFSKAKNYGAIKIKSVPVNNYIRCLSQGPWIDFYNVSETSAYIEPEKISDLEYNMNNYTASDFLAKENLMDMFNDWYNSLSEQERLNFQNDENAYLQFLRATKKIGDYLWWSKKGPGVYRYLKLVKNYSYLGGE